MQVASLCIALATEAATAAWGNYSKHKSWKQGNQECSSAKKDAREVAAAAVNNLHRQAGSLGRLRLAASCGILWQAALRGVQEAMGFGEGSLV